MKNPPGRPKYGKLTTISLKIPMHVHTALQDYSKNIGCSNSDLLRLALDDFLTARVKVKTELEIAQATLASVAAACPQPSRLRK